MTADASTIAGNNAKAPVLQFDRRYALVALHTARHQTCPAFGPLRLLLVDLLCEGGHSPTDAGLHADVLISIALGVIVSVEVGEPRKVPWPGGQRTQPYVQAMYEMETSK